jgi:hypothetical protein
VSLTSFILKINQFFTNKKKLLEYNALVFQLLIQSFIRDYGISKIFQLLISRSIKNIFHYSYIIHKSNSSRLKEKNCERDTSFKMDNKK